MNFCRIEGANNAQDLTTSTITVTTFKLPLFENMFSSTPRRERPSDAALWYFISHPQDVPDENSHTSSLFSVRLSPCMISR